MKKKLTRLSTNTFNLVKLGYEFQTNFYMVLLAYFFVLLLQKYSCKSEVGNLYG